MEGVKRGGCGLMGEDVVRGWGMKRGGGGRWGIVLLTSIFQ